MLAMKRDTFSCCIEEMCFVQRNMYFYRKICTFTEKYVLLLKNLWENVYYSGVYQSFIRCMTESHVIPLLLTEDGPLYT